ncbi:MAG TPA: ABC transporter permease [Gemmatimonadaceae bacterium]|nr:ABC transporter permease [Gemmatimonadaceae bacterium]
MTPLDPFLEAAVRTATSLALAAVGEAVVERSGVINIGLEGAVLAGAFGALVGAGVADSTAAGYLVGSAVGVLTAALFAVFAVTLRADQIITGTAINLLALGVTGALYRALYGASGAALSIPTSRPIAIPGLAELPLIGPALFAQTAPTYLLYLAVPLVALWMYRTQSGLSLRAIGEEPAAARAAGIGPARVRWLALLFGGSMGGLAGATLVLAQAGTFAEGMSAGRGFIAIAIVVLGRWHPVGVLIAALLFGAASALQFVFQSMGLELPYQLFLAFPYVLTLLALAWGARHFGRGAAPAALGRQDA